MVESFVNGKKKVTGYSNYKLLSSIISNSNENMKISNENNYKDQIIE